MKSHSSGKTNGKHTEKIREILDCYVSLDPKNHTTYDIEVFFDDKLQEIRWSCPCNPQRDKESSYLWQGAAKMEIHTQSKYHSAYIESGRPRASAIRRVGKEMVCEQYLSLSEIHLAGDIEIITDSVKGVYMLKCKCSPNKSFPFSREGLKAHVSSTTHAEFLNPRIEEQQKMLEKLHREKELKDELKRMESKVSDKEHKVVEKSNKRERSPSPIREDASSQPVVVVPLPEEKRRKSIRDQLRDECFVQIKIAQEECAQQLTNARKEAMEECIAELKRIDWKTIIKEQAIEYAKNMISSIADDLEPSDK